MEIAVVLLAIGVICLIDGISVLNAYLAKEVVLSDNQVRFVIRQIIAGLILAAPCSVIYMIYLMKLA